MIMTVNKPHSRYLRKLDVTLTFRADGAAAMNSIESILVVMCEQAIAYHAD